MAQYATLKAAIDAVIKANGQREITGTVLNQTLNAMVNSLGADYQFAGVATPSTNPGTPDQNVFYLAGQGGTYSNFNNIVLPDGVSILMWNGSWSSQTVLAGDGGVFDISDYKATGGTLAKFTDLAAALDGGNNVPVDVRRGGMQVRFVQSSDNKYVQYRLMSDSFNTTVANWQGVDDEPTAGSDNLVKSGGVYNSLRELNSNISYEQEFVFPTNNSWLDVSPIIPAGSTINKVTSSGTLVIYFRYIDNTDVSFDTTKPFFAEKDIRYIGSTYACTLKISVEEKRFAGLNKEFYEADSVPTQNSKHIITSGAVFTALGQKQNTLTFDDLPTANSNNPVKSKGIVEYVENEKEVKVGDGMDDLSIDDPNYYKIVSFKNGHVKTKYFDSEILINTTIPNILSEFEKGRKSSVLFNYDFSASISSDIYSNENWGISNGSLVSNNAGLANRLISKKQTSIDSKETMCRFVMHSNTKFAIGFSPYDENGNVYCNSMISVEPTKINVHEAWTNLSAVPDVRSSLDYNFVNGREYILHIVKDEHTNLVYITDGLTSINSNILTVKQTNVNGSYDEFAGGRQMGNVSIIHLEGTSPEIKKLYCTMFYSSPKLIIYGDSITEGDRVYNGTFGELLKQYLSSKEVAISGQSGTVILSAIHRMQSELPILKPQYVMLSIGTNGNNSQALFDQAKALIESNNAIPIINVIPMSSTMANVADVRTYALNENCLHARFDIATALNNDISSTYNPALFADGTHPNNAGHTALYQRILSDVLELNN